MNRKLKKSRYQSGGNLNPLDPDRYGKPVELTIEQKRAQIQALLDADKQGKIYKPPMKRGTPSPLKGGVDESVNSFEVEIAKRVLDLKPEVADKAAEVINKLSSFSRTRSDGYISDEEKAYREKLVAELNPYGYGINDAYESSQPGSLRTTNKDRENYVRNYFGLDHKMKKSAYNPEAYLPDDLADEPYDKKSIYRNYVHSSKNDENITKGKHGLVANTLDVLSPLGDFTLSRGIDDRGHYISLYDKWDLDPLSIQGGRKDIELARSVAPDLNILNHPFEVYDRIYLDELKSLEKDSVFAIDEKLGIIPMDKRTKKLQVGGDLISQLGYRNDSPFKNAPSLNINSPNISMENVSTPLYGISNQTGETKLMKPNKKYKFKNTSSVTEVPAYRKGGKINCATGGLLEGLTQAASGIAPFLGPIGAGISAASALAPFVKDLFAKPDDTIVSGSPGAYQIGGDIQMQRSTTTVTPRPLQELNLPLSPRDQNLQQILGMQKDSATPQMRIEHALDMLRLSGQNPEHLKAYHKIVSGADPEKLTIQRKRMDRFRERQTGGDLELSSNAFQVQGNPNVVDGNNYPSLNANLDHNEVVTNTQEGQKFVFSADLKDPQTGKSFADLAAKQEKAKGKAEKLLKTYPYDEQAKSTISMSNANLNHISNIQEAVATVLGYRNSDGSTKQNYQSGGYIDLGEGYFYDPQKHIYLNRGKSGDSVVEPNNYVRSLKEAYDLRNAPYNPNYIRDRQTTGLTPSNTPVTPTPPVTAPTLRTGKTSKPSKVAASDKLGWLEKAQNYNRLNPDPYAEQAEATKAAGGLRETPTSLTMDQRAAIADPNFGARQTFYEEESDTPLQTGLTADRIPATIATDVSYKTPWTLGDTFKGIELLSKGIGAFGKAEKEQPLLDNTQITQEVYDPTQALYSNQRNYQNNLNALSATTPINLRRGIAGSALASRYSADNQVVSQYQQMNQGARSQYQDRVGQQRRFNTASQFRTNEVNAANRAAQDAVQQNFFTSIGQFGEDLNRKRYAADIINLYRNQAPDVFDSYIKTLGTYGRR